MQSHDQRAAMEKDVHQPGREGLCGFLELLATLLPNTGTLVIVLESISVAVWLLAVMWLNFIGAAKVDFALAVAGGVLVGVLTLLLTISSIVFESSVAIDGPRQSGRSRAAPALLESAPKRQRGPTMRGAPWPNRAACLEL